MCILRIVYRIVIALFSGKAQIKIKVCIYCTLNKEVTNSINAYFLA